MTLIFTGNLYEYFYCCGWAEFLGMFTLDGCGIDQHDSFAQSRSDLLYVVPWEEIKELEKAEK